jgi:hypothetical protein
MLVASTNSPAALRIPAFLAIISCGREAEEERRSGNSWGSWTIRILHGAGLEGRRSAVVKEGRLEDGFHSIRMSSHSNACLFAWLTKESTNR